MSKSNRYCSVPFCYSWSKKTPELSFHFLPKKGVNKVRINTKFGGSALIDRQNAWISRLRIKGRLSKYMRVCSLHFTEDDYFVRGNSLKRKWLKRTAVPSKKLPLTGDNDKTSLKIVKQWNKRIKNEKPESYNLNKMQDFLVHNVIYIKEKYTSDDFLKEELEKTNLEDVIKKEVVENDSDNNIDDEDIDSMRIKPSVESDVDISFIKKEIDPDTTVLNTENNNYQESVQQSFVDNADINITNQLNCPVCFKTFKTWTRFKMHKRTHIVMKILRCNRCGFTCDDIQNLSNHIRKKHGLLNGDKCNNCGKIFCHDSNFTDGADNTNIPCPFCKLKAKNETQNRSNHGLTNSNHMLLCDRCGFMCTLRMSLNDHVEVHHNT